MSRGRGKDGFAGLDDLEATRRYRASDDRDRERNGNSYDMVFDVSEDRRPSHRSKRRSRSRSPRRRYDNDLFEEKRRDGHRNRERDRMDVDYDRRRRSRSRDRHERRR